METEEKRIETPKALKTVEKSLKKYDEVSLKRWKRFTFDTLVKYTVDFARQEGGINNEVLRKLGVIIGGVNRPVILVDKENNPIALLPGFFATLSPVGGENIEQAINRAETLHRQPGNQSEEIVSTMVIPKFNKDKAFLLWRAIFAKAMDIIEGGKPLAEIEENPVDTASEEGTDDEFFIEE